MLIDLSKAFDSVPHQLLVQELMGVGCGRDACEWFGSYLSRREQRVLQGNGCAQWKAVTKGVPQGSCLSPLLFNLFVRELPSSSSLDTFQFADDITSSAADKDLTVVASLLTTSFEQIREYCEGRHLSINEAKTQLIVFKTPGRRLPDNFEITLGNTTIKPLSSVKILGVSLDQHLTMGRKCNGLIGSLSRAAPYLSHQLLRMAYISLVRTHLEYCSALLHPAARTHLTKLDIVQKKAALWGSPHHPCRPSARILEA